MESTGLSAIDVGILLIILLSTVLALWRGIIRTLFAILAFVLALLASWMFTEWVAARLPFLQDYPILAALTAFVLVFVGVLVLVSLPGGIAERMIKASNMKFLDRGLGFVFGILRGVVIVMILVWLLQLVPGVKTAMSKEQSVLLPYFVTAVDKVRPWLSRVSVPEIPRP